MSMTGHDMGIKAVYNRRRHGSYGRCLIALQAYLYIMQEDRTVCNYFITVCSSVLFVP
jgi:hypothetical protein